MDDPAVAIKVVAILLFSAAVIIPIVVLRWIFRVNKQIELLEQILNALIELTKITRTK